MRECIRALRPDVLALQEMGSVAVRGAYASGVWFLASRRKHRLTNFARESIAIIVDTKVRARRPNWHARRVRYLFPRAVRTANIAVVATAFNF